MKKIYITIAFSLLALIQLYVPTQMILNQESVLNEGKAYKFTTRPIDPNDPFRGKYITLSYEMNSVKTNDSTWRRNDDVYVYLKDSIGYAKIDTISKYKLDTDTDFVIAKAGWFSKASKFNNHTSKLNFNLPFDRFYMEEFKSKTAENAVRIRLNDSVIKNIYGLVYVKDGNSVLENVFINDTPIKDYVEQNTN